jgi:glycosyltransferase 2 family protein
MSQTNVSNQGNPVLRQWRLILGVAISAFFLVWAVGQVSDFGAVGSALREANYLYLVPALGAYFFGVWIRSARWHYLLRPLRQLTPNALFPVVVIGYMANDVLPARLGEVVRAYVLGEREGLPKSAVLATIVVERTFDGIAMLLFIVAVTFFVPLDARLQGIFQVAALVFVGALAAFFVVASRPRIARQLIDTVGRVLPARFGPSFVALANRFLAGFGVFQSGRLLLATFALSIAAWLAEAAMYLIVARGFGLALPTTAYLLTTAFANLAGMVPSAPGYVGPFEFGALASLSLFGLSAEQALSYVLVLHVALLVPVTLLGFVFLWRYGLSLRSLWSSKARTEV